MDARHRARRPGRQEPRVAFALVRGGTKRPGIASCGRCRASWHLRFRCVGWCPAGDRNRTKPRVASGLQRPFRAVKLHTDGAVCRKLVRAGLRTAKCWLRIRASRSACRSSKTGPASRASMRFLCWSSSTASGSRGGRGIAGPSCSLRKSEVVKPKLALCKSFGVEPARYLASGWTPGASIRRVGSPLRFATSRSDTRTQCRFPSSLFGFTGV